MGGQDYPKYFHYAIFNKEYLSNLLLKIGFTVINELDSRTVDHHDFDDWTSVRYEVNNKEYKISLNLEAVN